MDPEEPQSFFLGIFLWSAIFPAVIAGCIVGLKTILKSDKFSWLLGWAAIAGLATTYWGIEGPPTFTPHATYQWLPLLGIGTAIIFSFESLFNRKRSLRGLAKIAVLVFALWPFFKTFSRQFEGLTQFLLVLSILTWALLLWFSLDLLAPRKPSLGSFTTLTILFIGCSLTFLLGGSAKLSHFAGGLAAALGTMAFLSIWQPQLTSSPSLHAVLVAFLLSMTANGYFLAEVPLLSTLCLMIGPFVYWLMVLKPVSKLSRWREAFFMGLVSVVPAGLAILLAL